MGSPVSLVTGGCGFIGQHLVRLLSEHGRRVRVLDTAAARDLPRGAEVIRGSILDQDQLRSAFRGVDVVYHLAANPSLWARDKREFEQVNFIGTKRVLAEAERSGVDRIVYTSTESIMGWSRHDPSAPTTEDMTSSIADVPGPYCRSKLMAEEEAARAAERGLPVVIVNPTLPVGPGDWRRTPPTAMILMFLNGEAPAYLDCTLNFIDVRDAALGHLLAAQKGRIGERYILGNENIRLSELLDLLRDLTGLPMPHLRIPYGVALAFAAVSEFVADHISHRPPQAPLTGVRLVRRPFVFDSSKAASELGLPRTPLYSSLGDAIRWFEEQGWLKRSPRHIIPERTSSGGSAAA